MCYSSPCVLPMSQNEAQGIDPSTPLSKASGSNPSPRTERAGRRAPLRISPVGSHPNTRKPARAGDRGSRFTHARNATQANKSRDEWSKRLFPQNLLNQKRRYMEERTALISGSFAGENNSRKNQHLRRVT